MSPLILICARKLNWTAQFDWFARNERRCCIRMRCAVRSKLYAQYVLVSIVWNERIIYEAQRFPFHEWRSCAQRNEPKPFLEYVCVVQYFLLCSFFPRATEVSGTPFLITLFLRFRQIFQYEIISKRLIWKIR